MLKLWTDWGLRGSGSRALLALLIAASLPPPLTAQETAPNGSAPTAQSCATNVCSNGGSCFVVDASFQCLCPLGFSGTLCEVEEACPDAPCPAGSLCLGGACRCPAGFDLTPQGCAATAPLLASNPCEALSCDNGGVCLVGEGGTAKCSCQEGTAGDRCQLITAPPMDPCKGVVCAEGQQCIGRGPLSVCAPLPNASLPSGAADPCQAFPCANRGLCTHLPGVQGFRCTCAAGWTGPRCEAAVSECAFAASPCLNGGLCQDAQDGGFNCLCKPGFTGQLCEASGSACAGLACLNGGTCQDGGPAGFTCLCPPGFSGQLCQSRLEPNGSGVGSEEEGQSGPGQDKREDGQDDCAGVTCPQPGQVCVDGDRSHTCQCPPGFTGPSCSSNIDECGGEPCLNGATCVDAPGNFSCLCAPGFVGRLCEAPLDPCSSSLNPCQNGGTCVFGGPAVGVQCRCPLGISGLRCELSGAALPNPCLPVNPCNGGYCRPHPMEPSLAQCECSNTGRVGERCELELPQSDVCQHASPCRNGGTCRPTPGQGRGHACQCPEGFSGLDCESDIEDCASSPCLFGGRCLERSRPESYGPGLIDAAFGEVDGAGFFCLCPQGLTGERCEEELPGCDPSPCLNGGVCTAHPVLGFACRCPEGWLGPTCGEPEAKCAAIPPPCAQDTQRCVDTTQGPKCLCSEGWGGPDCSYTLVGCADDPCPPHLECRASLGPAREQLYECRCPMGRGGPGCGEETVASFAGSSLLAVVSNPPTASFNLSLAFRTTVGGSVLVSGADILGSPVFALALRSGQELLLTWGSQSTSLSLPLGSESLTDGEWRVIDVAWSGSFVYWRLHAASGHELLSQSLSLLRPTLPVFNTRFGGTPVPRADGLGNFVGCLGDMELNGGGILPSRFLASSVNVSVGCLRRDQCPAGACSGQGACVDLWSSSRCECHRPWMGAQCQDQLSAATFGHERMADQRSYAQIQMSTSEEESLELSTDISFLLRTRSPFGSLLYLGSAANPNPQLDTFVAAELSEGQLRANVKLGGKDIVALTGGPRLDDGELHLVRLKRVENDVTGYVDGEQVFSGKLRHPFPHPLLATHFYLAGHPPLTRSKRQAGLPSAVALNPAAFSTDEGFKGVLQDLRVNGFFVPLIPGQRLAAPTLGRTILGSGVLEGSVSDDSCAREPCQNGGTCAVTFNDYSCRCIAGWRGKDCLRRDFCAQLNICPQGAACENTQTGYLCTGPATLEAHSGAQLTLTSDAPIDNSLSLSIRTRQTDGSVLYAAAQDGSWLLLALRDGSLDLEYQLGPESGKEANLTQSVVADGEWHKLTLSLGPEQSLVIVGSEDKESIHYLEGRTGGSMASLFAAQSPLFVGAVPEELMAYTPARFLGLERGFKGCVEGLRIGTALPTISLLAPEEYGAPDEAHFAPIASQSIVAGCRGDDVCGPDGVVGPCQNGSPCRDLWNLRQCDCVTGFDGELCGSNIDDCAGHSCDPANGRCVDGIAAYTCTCNVGYEGQFCERETNECESFPCENGGTCLDQIGSFKCQCNANFTGDLCEFLLTVDCDSSPCMNGGSCSDAMVGQGAERRKSFQCACPPGYRGRTCDFEIDYCEENPCLMGSTCLSVTEELSHKCLCRPGFTGPLCDVDVDECGEAPCANGATCVDGLANFTCVCHKGWRGERCTVDVDECASSPCEAGGACANSPGAYACQCPPFHLGEHCELAGTCLTEPCGQHGECVQVQAARHKCECEHGYEGAACETEINYCEPENPCLEGGICIRKVGGFTCQCVPGFRGERCEVNIDECEPQPCVNGGRCVDGRNSYSCICDGTGYEGDNCQEDINECLERSNCVSGSCVNSAGGYACACTQGFVGRRCAHRDPCLSGNATAGLPRLNDSPAAASLTSSSPSGSGGPPTLPSPACLNGGLCLNGRVEGLSVETERLAFDCRCKEDFDGAKCEIPLSRASDGINLAYIIGPIVGLLAIVAIVVVVAFAMVARKKRANRGTYSPSRQEMSGARVQLGPMIKPPPQERLI